MTTEQPRFIVHVSEGFRTEGNRGGSSRGSAITATVHDRLLLFRTVGMFRSEDFRHQVGRFGSPKLPEMLAATRAAADDLAAKLNASVAE